MAVIPSESSLTVSRVETTLSELDEGRGDWKHEALAKVTFKEFRGHKGVVTSCDFSGFNDEFMVSASHDATVKFWNLDKGSCVHTYYDGHSGEISEARCSPDGQMIVSCGWDKKLIVRNTETGQKIWTGYHEGISTSCKFSNDGKFVVSSSDFENAIMIWDAYTGELIKALPDHHESSILNCLFSPQDDRIATVSLDKSAKLYDLRSDATTLVLKNHSLPVSNATFTNDERTLCTVSWDRSIAFYDISTGMYRSDGPHIMRRAHEGCISCCQFTDDGSQLITGGYDTHICIWDVQHKIMKLRVSGHKGWIESVAVSHDSQWVASASRDKTVRVWNLSRADQIPMVLEKRRAIGLKMFTCERCSKPFSLSEMDVQEKTDVVLCVFCRLEETQSRLSDYKHI